MKLQSSKIQDCLQLTAVRGVLVYGPDNGQIHEVLETLTTAIVANSQDHPFRVSNMTALEVSKDPSFVANTLTTVPLTGGRRVVRIYEADDSIANLLETLLAIPSRDALVVVIASGTLGKESKLRLLFESACTHVVAIPCYPDDAQTLENLIDETLQQFGLRGEEAAVAYLVERLGSDRLQTRRELEKLALYACSAGNTVSLADAMTCIGDNAELSLQSFVMAVADGDTTLTDRLYERLILEGMTPVGVLRALAYHFRRLSVASGIMAGDHGRAEQAMARLRPPPFFKIKDRFKTQLLTWPAMQLLEVLEILIRAEIDCKTTGRASDIICCWTLLQLVRRGKAFHKDARARTVDSCLV